MVTRSGRYRRQRDYVAASTVVVLGHVLVFGLMALELRPAPGLAGNEGTIVTAELVGEAPAQPVSRPAPEKPARPKIPPPTPAPTPTAQAAEDAQAPAESIQAPQLNDAEAAAVAAFDGGASAAGGPDAPCDLTSTLATAFAGSPQVRQALDELPVEQRSVANAINLWDGQWPAETLSGGKGLLRVLLTKALGAARPDCLTNDNHGPALFFVPDNGSVAVLAIGSGTWRWSDLTAAPAQDGEILSGPASEIARLP